MKESNDYSAAFAGNLEVLVGVFGILRDLVVAR